jgi:hypothetical protein
MKREYMNLLLDASLSTDARVLGLYVATLGDGAHEVERDVFRRLLHGPASKDRVGRALGELELRGWVDRKPGGRGHSDSFSFTVASSETVSDSVNELSTLNGHSVNESETLKAPSSTTAATTATATRGSARESDLSFQHLRVLLGVHAGVLDRFDRSAAHGETWPAAALGLFRPPGNNGDGGGTEWAVLKALDSREHQVEALAQAFEDFAAAHHVWKPRHFRGFVLSAVQAIQLREKRLAAGVEEPVPRPARSLNGNGGKPGRRPMDEQVYSATEHDFQFNPA